MMRVMGVTGGTSRRCTWLFGIIGKESVTDATDVQCNNGPSGGGMRRRDGRARPPRGRGILCIGISATRRGGSRREGEVDSVERAAARDGFFGFFFGGLLFVLG